MLALFLNAFKSRFVATVVVTGAMLFLAWAIYAHNVAMCKKRVAEAVAANDELWKGRLDDAVNAQYKIRADAVTKAYQAGLIEADRRANRVAAVKSIKDNAEQEAAPLDVCISSDTLIAIGNLK